MSFAVKTEGLGKKYLIGHQRQERYETFRDMLMHKARGIGQRLRHPLSPNAEDIELEELWALRGVDLEIQQGEKVGIIGRNGAGKTTLLKLLSRITEPSEGRFTINGRVSSLLEVGTGFHPELTGRENIFLNGAILGMSRAEIRSRFDEIVDFAEVERFLDTPVKRYSSGMYVRLAFAVAAHLEPEILIVDEVLSVGDAAFQKKCLGKMGEFAGSGRTVLFVSHNMAAVRQICERAVLLERGSVVADGPAGDMVKIYLERQGDDIQFTNRIDRTNSPQLQTSGSCDEIVISEIAIDNHDDLNQGIVTGGGFSVRIRYEGIKHNPAPAFVVMLRDIYGTEVLRLSTMPISGFVIDKLFKQGEVRLSIESLPLVAGQYFLTVGFVRERVEWLIRLEDVLAFNVNPYDVYGSGMALDRERGMIVVDHKWSHSVI